MSIDLATIQAKLAAPAGWGCEKECGRDDVVALVAEVRRLLSLRWIVGTVSCPDCSGMGWSVEGSYEAPEQVHCERCLGTGALAVSGREAELVASVEQLREALRAVLANGERIIWCDRAHNGGGNPCGKCAGCKAYEVAKAALETAGEVSDAE